MPLNHSWTNCFGRLVAIPALLLLPLSGLTPAAEVMAKKSEPQVGFSHPRGFCEKPFALTLISPAANATIRFTFNGSEPTLWEGADYVAVLQITNTTVVRAAAFRNGARVSPVTTHSYIFLSSALRQPFDPAGFPAGPRAWNGFPAIYGMDPRVVAEELKRNAEFCLTFASRAQKHFFGDGALTPKACIGRWMQRANEVDRAMIAESARWGYYRRKQPFTRDWIGFASRNGSSKFTFRNERKS